jgi:hypothetical protein
MIRGPVDPRLLRPTAVQQKKKALAVFFFVAPRLFESVAKDVIQLYRSAQY